MRYLSFRTNSFENLRFFYLCISLHSISVNFSPFKWVFSFFYSNMRARTVLRQFLGHIATLARSQAPVMRFVLPPLTFFKKSPFPPLSALTVAPHPPQLMSYHSVSKGILGECGRRGGYLEVFNIDSSVKDQVRRALACSLGFHCLLLSVDPGYCTSLVPHACVLVEEDLSVLSSEDPCVHASSGEVLIISLLLRSTSFSRSVCAQILRGRPPSIPWSTPRGLATPHMNFIERCV